MQERIISTPTVAMLGTARPLSARLISFTNWARNAQLISLPLLLIAPIALAPVFDGDVTPALASPWVKMVLTPLYDNYSELVQLQTITFIVVVVTAFIAGRLASRECQWPIHSFILLTAGFGGISALIILSIYGVAILLAIPMLFIKLAELIAYVLPALVEVVIGGIVILSGSALFIAIALASFVASIVIWAAGASNRYYEEQEFRYQQERQRQLYPYRPNLSRAAQRSLEYYASDE